MRPWLALRAGSAAWVHQAEPHRLICISRWYQARSLTWSNSACADMPALFTSTSIAPKAPSVARTSSWQSSWDSTSQRCTSVRAPSASHSAATRSSLSTLRAASTSESLAPSRRAHWRASSAPMPSEAPVMITTMLSPFSLSDPEPECLPRRRGGPRSVVAPCRCASASSAAGAQKQAQIASPSCCISEGCV